MRAASFVDDIARWGTVTPLALDSQDYDDVFCEYLREYPCAYICEHIALDSQDHEHDDVFCEDLYRKRKHTWPPTWFPFLSVRVEHHGILSSASTRIHLPINF